MLTYLFTEPILFFVWCTALIIAVTVHEFAHAWTAVYMGDPTPKIQGRLTLNPLAHLDPLGTLLMLLVRFGWGKPVQFDPYNLKNPRRDAAIISIAGPASNLLLAGVLSVVLRFAMTPLSPFGFLATIIPPVIFLNVVLAVFNLIPIHPLDGGKVLVGLLPRHSAHDIDKLLHQYGMYILILLIFPIWGGASPVTYLISPVINLLLSIYLPSSPLI